MIDVEQRVLAGTTLTLSEKDPQPNLEQPFDVVEELLSKDLDYIIDEEDDAAEECCKDEPEMEVDLPDLVSSSVELEEMSAMHKDLTHEAGSSALEVASILSLPSMAAEKEPSSRRPAARRRRSDEYEHTVNANDAGESDAVMTYLREIGRVPMITHEREIELAQRIEAGDYDAKRQF
ncbi:MAG: sigma-70 factor domain-containing protein, partial [Ktedonobacteraceae bacterium]